MNLSVIRIIIARALKQPKKQNLTYVRTPVGDADVADQFLVQQACRIWQTCHWRGAVWLTPAVVCWAHWRTFVRWTSVIRKSPLAAWRHWSLSSCCRSCTSLTPPSTAKRLLVCYHMHDVYVCACGSMNVCTYVWLSYRHRYEAIGSVVCGSVYMNDLTRCCSSCCKSYISPTLPSTADRVCVCGDSSLWLTSCRRWYFAHVWLFVADVFDKPLVALSVSGTRVADDCMRGVTALTALRCALVSS